VSLAVFERDGLKAALKKAGLFSENIDKPDLLFWRFETQDAVPVGFGLAQVPSLAGRVHRRRDPPRFPAGALQ
jgi:hypothetical protein